LHDKFPAARGRYWGGSFGEERRKREGRKKWEMRGRWMGLSSERKS